MLGGFIILLTVSNILLLIMSDQANPTEVQTALGFGQGVSGGPGITQSFTRSEDGGWCETVVFS